MMKTIFSTLCVSMLILFTGCAGSEISEKMVLDTLAEFDKSIVEKNVEKSASFMADDISITIYVTNSGKTQTIRSNKKEYILKTKQAYSTIENYKYSRTVEEVEIDNDVAKVTSNIEELWTINGTDSSATTKEKTTIKMVNGRLLTTKLLSATET